MPLIHVVEPFRFAHCTPQPPQLFTSVRGSTQTPPQSVHKQGEPPAPPELLDEDELVLELEEPPAPPDPPLDELELEDDELEDEAQQPPPPDELLEDEVELPPAPLLDDELELEVLLDELHFSHEPPPELLDDELELGAVKPKFPPKMEGSSPLPHPTRARKMADKPRIMRVFIGSPASTRPRIPFVQPTILKFVV
jgi:hypothetical protein